MCPLTLRLAHHCATCSSLLSLSKPKGGVCLRLSYLSSKTHEPHILLYFTDPLLRLPAQALGRSLLRVDITCEEAELATLSSAFYCLTVRLHTAWLRSVILLAGTRYDCPRACTTERTDLLTFQSLTSPPCRRMRAAPDIGGEHSANHSKVQLLMLLPP